MIKYKKMSLFDAPEGSILVHACNAQGVWGSGIAAEFKERYPRSFKEYYNFCDREVASPGTVICHSQENKRHPVSLITSLNFGKDRDDETTILVNTTLALNEMCQEYFSSIIDNDAKFYSNKFNSGMFKVPWERTEEILKVFIKRYGLDWTVCEWNG